MANNNLTVDDITRESLRILHQKLNFVTNIVTEYDDSFAQSGAKIGNTLRIRQPIQYLTGTGATIATGTTADTLENSTTLTVNSQRHVPMRFTSNEMTMKIDEFSARHIEPAMAVLAAKIESDALSMTHGVFNLVAAGTKVEFADVMEGRRKLVDNLAPTGDRFALLDSQANADLVNELKGLFQAPGEIARQNKEGMMGRTAGFDFYENTLMPSLTTGAEAGGAVYDVNGNQSHSYTKFNEATLAVVTGTKTLKKGDVFTIANVYRVHPETKQSTGELQEFVVRTDYAGGAGNIDISPGIVISGPYQNVSAQAATGAAITVKNAASTAYKQSLLFQKGFACFATADLVLPSKGVMAASRQVYDGISMRLVQDYDVVKDRIYTRVDVLYGYRILRPQLACKILHT